MRERANQFVMATKRPTAPTQKLETESPFSPAGLAGDGSIVAAAAAMRARPGRATEFELSSSTDNSTDNSGRLETPLAQGREFELARATGVGVGDGRLEYVNADGVSQSRLLLDTTTIGRHTDNDLQLLDPEVSKSHLIIRRTSEGYVLEDLGSVNGTLVNGARQPRFRLQDNDVLLVGNSALRFRLEPRRRSAPSAERPRSVELVAPLSSFAEIHRSGDPAAAERDAKPGSDKTLVTLVPENLMPEGSAASVVTEQPAGVDFRAERQIDEERALRRDYERLRVAFELMTEIGLETNLDALGQRILERIRVVLPTDTAVIMLRDPALGAAGDGIAEHSLVTLASWAESGSEVRIPRAIVDRVLESRGGLLTSDAQVDQQLQRSETVVGQRIRSALCVPLVVRGEILGVIHVSSHSVAGAYEEKDLALLRAIAQPAALAVANARLRKKIEEEAQTRAELSRFLSPALVEKAVRNELDVGKAGDKVSATVLFADIRGFTSMSDGQAPETVVSMLNEYFDAMVEVVFDHGGTLDKFIGDGLMAVWGTPVQAPDDAARAVRAAAHMRAMLEGVVNPARRTRGEAPLRVGYGIATGQVIAGAMGARRRQDFTVIGDVVNLSSRLCGEATAGQILVDESTERICKKLGIRVRPLDPRAVKGFSRPVFVFEVQQVGGDLARQATAAEAPAEGADG